MNPPPRTAPPLGLWLIRAISALAFSLMLFRLAQGGHLASLSLIIGITLAVFTLRIGEQAQARYGRRVTVTEMLPLGRQGDRQLLLGGIAGYLMLACFALAAWLAF
ncbi:MAG: hypothetical protein PHT48_08455 [Dechloromonas sp.]|nr:hypothetical protein [Dechloromonas sp.]